MCAPPLLQPLRTLTLAPSAQKGRTPSHLAEQYGRSEVAAFLAAEQLFSLLEDCGLTKNEMDRFKKEDICSIATLKEFTKADLRQDLELSLGKAANVSRAVLQSQLDGDLARLSR